MSPLAGLLALLMSGTAAIDYYGIEISEVDGGLVIISVAAGSRAEKEGILVGSRVTSVNGLPVDDLGSLRAALKTGRAITLTLEDPSAARFSARRAPHRLSLLIFGNAVSDQTNSRSAWLGLTYGYQVIDHLWALLGLGYVPVGKTPFVNGRNAFAALLGLELELPFAARWSALLRALAGPAIPWSNGSGSVFGIPRWRIEKVMAVGQLGVRWGVLGIFASLGFGPAEGFNAGGGLSVNFSFGRLRPRSRASKQR